MHTWIIHFRGFRVFFFTSDLLPQNTINIGFSLLDLLISKGVYITEKEGK